MPTLIASLSSGKGTWTEVVRIMQAQPWDKIFLITNQFGQEKFTIRPPNTQLLLINPDQEISFLTEEIKKQLQRKINDFEIALNFASGSGKEHMALLEAVMQLGLNFRLVTWQNNQMEVMGIRK